MSSVQRKASLQETMSGDISDTRTKEVGREIAEMERRIQVARRRQEQCQEKIDGWEQDLQRTSQEQSEGGELRWVSDVFGYRSNTCATYMVPAVSAHTAQKKNKLEVALTQMGYLSCRNYSYHLPLLLPRG